MEKIKSVFNLFTQNTLASGMNYLFRFQYEPLHVPLWVNFSAWNIRILHSIFHFRTIL